MDLRGQTRFEGAPLNMNRVVIHRYLSASSHLPTPFLISTK